MAGWKSWLMGVGWMDGQTSPPIVGKEVPFKNINPT